MSFLYPQLFGVMAVPLVIFAYFILTHTEHFLQVFDEKVLRRLTIGDDALPPKIRNLLMLVALFFLVVALGRPVIDHGSRVVHLKGLSVVVALDISGSMRTEDTYPNRLKFAKKKIGELLYALPHDDVSLVAFAYTTFILAPFTSDKETLKVLLDGVSDNYINMGATNFRALSEFSVELFKDKTPKVMVVFSDGGDRDDLESFSEVIKRENIVLYAVMVGTEQGGKVIDENKRVVRRGGKMVISRRNDKLGEIAIESGGAYVVAGNGNEINGLVKKIKSTQQSDDKGQVTIYDREELFYYPLGVGLFFLLLSFVSIPNIKKRGVDDE